MMHNITIQFNDETGYWTLGSDKYPYTFCGEDINTAFEMMPDKLQEPKEHEAPYLDTEGNKFYEGDTLQVTTIGKLGVIYHNASETLMVERWRVDLGCQNISLGSAIAVHGAVKIC